MPNATPDTTPDIEPIVAIAVLLLVHLPPDTPFVRVMVEPTHNALGPPMAVGAVLTVITAVTAQPMPKE